MTDGHYGNQTVCIGVFPAQTTVLYPSGQQGNGRSAPPLLSLWGSIFHANGVKVVGFMENYAFHAKLCSRPSSLRPLHRYLIHYVLAERGFNPPGMVFSVSAAILDNINAYLRILESYSVRLLPFIKWKATGERIVSRPQRDGRFLTLFRWHASRRISLSMAWQGQSIQIFRRRRDAWYLRIRSGIA
ncbi:hypothetical protein ACYCVF_31405 [Bradyrhizobium sp. 1.29L]